MAQICLCENFFGEEGMRFTYSNNLDRVLIVDAADYHKKQELKKDEKFKNGFGFASLSYNKKELDKIADDIMAALSIVTNDYEEYKKEILKLFPFVDEYGWNVDISFKKEMFDSLEYIDKILKSGLETFYVYSTVVKTKNV